MSAFAFKASHGLAWGRDRGFAHWRQGSTWASADGQGHAIRGHARTSRRLAE